MLYQVQNQYQICFKSPIYPYNDKNETTTNVDVLNENNREDKSPLPCSCSTRKSQQLSIAIKSSTKTFSMPFRRIIPVNVFFLFCGSVKQVLRTSSLLLGRLEDVTNFREISRERQQNSSRCATRRNKPGLLGYAQKGWRIFTMII